MIPGTEIPSDLEKNLRFSSYRYDPVTGKYFVQARFYDSTGLGYSSAKGYRHRTPQTENGNGGSFIIDGGKEV